MATFRLVDFKIDWKNLLIQGAQSSSTFIVGQVKGIAQNVLLFTVNFIVALFTLFFFLRDGAELVSRIQWLLPMDQEHQQRLFKNIVDSVLAAVHGSLVVAMVQGMLAGWAYWFLGVPYAVLWGVVTAFVSLLPLGGSAVVSIPAAIYLFLQGETVRGIVGMATAFVSLLPVGWVGDRFDTGRDFTCFSIAKRCAESCCWFGAWDLSARVDNILKPLLIGNRLGLPVLFLFFGILAGLSLFGAVGIVLGPALLALLRALLDLYSEEYSNIERP